MPTLEPLTEQVQIESLKAACIEYKKIFSEHKNNVNINPSLWFIGEKYYLISSEVAAREKVTEMYKKHKGREPTIQELDIEMKKRARYTGTYSKLKRDYVALTEEEKNKKIEKYQQKINIINNILTSLDKNDLKEAAKIYVYNRDILEQDISTREQPSLTAICLIAGMIIFGIPLLPLALPVLVVTFVASPLLPSPDKSPAERMRDWAKNDMTTNSVLALENECLTYKRQLEKKKLGYNEKLKQHPSHKIQNKFNEKNVKLQKKIAYLNDLLITLQQTETSDTDKIKSFRAKVEPKKTDKEHVLSEKKDAREKLFINIIGYVLATTVTLGLYAVVRSSHAYATRDTSKFWHTKKDTFKGNVEQILKRPPRK